MKEIFLDTDNVTRFNDICAELEDRRSLIGPSLAVVTGPAGRGKSESAKRYAVNSSAVYIPPMITTSPLTLLQEITIDLAKVRPGRMAACLEVIQSEMNRLRRIIIIDEADLLPMKILEMLRNMNERYACPVLLIGEDGLRSRIATRRRLSSRVRRSMDFGAITQPDIVVFFRKSLEKNIEPAVASLIHRHSQGDWRPVLKIAADIERAIEASGLKTIPEDLVKAIIDEDGKR
jgi:DNA transposition AAA+ family ATPase